MSDVFISYSRKDADFVRSLHAALESAGRESWVDWEGIPPSAEWMAEIQRAIAAANTFVFVISPHSVQSSVCRDEVEYAATQGKRIVPVVSVETAPESVPVPVARLNWIFFQSKDTFHQSFATLLQALDTDLEHLRSHTRILVRTRAWVDNHEDPSHLLRGSDLEAAEHWLKSSEGKEPPVTPVQARYLAESRRVQAQRQRRLLGGVLVALVVSLVLGTIAYVQRNAAIVARDEAERQRRVAVARALATESELAVGGSGERLVTATLLAVESLRSTATSEGRTAWQRRMALLPRAPYVMSDNLGATTAGAFNNALDRWVVGTEAGEVVLGNVQDGKVLQRWQAVQSPVRSLAFSPAGDVLAVGARQEIAVWSTAAPSLLARLTPEGTRLDTLGWVRDLLFSHDGKHLYAAAEGYGVEVVSTNRWQFEEPLRYEESRVFALAMHPQRELLALGGFGWAAADPAIGRLEVIPDQRREEIAAMRFSHSGFELAIADLAVRVWDVAPLEDGSLTAESADRLIVTNDRVHDLDFDPSGQYLAISRDGMAQVLVAKSGEEVQRVAAPGSLWRATFRPDGAALLTLGERFQARHLYQAYRRYHRDFDAKIREAYFVADGRWLLTVDSAGRLRVLDPDGLETVSTLLLGRRPRTTTSPDGRWFATIGSDALLVADAQSLEQVAPPELSPGTGPTGVSFDPGSRYLLALAGGFVAVLDISAGQWRNLVPQETDAVSARTGRFSEDGRWLALRGRGGVQLFRTGDWQAYPALGQGTVIALSPDETLACTQTPAQRGRRSAMLHVWRLATGQRVAWGPEPGGVPLSDVLEDRGGDASLLQKCSAWPQSTWVPPRSGGPRQSERWLVTTADESVIVYPLAVADMIAEACARVDRNLTREEWQRYLPDEPYRATCNELPAAASELVETINQ